MIKSSRSVKSLAGKGLAFIDDPNNSVKEPFLWQKYRIFIKDVVPAPIQALPSSGKEK